MVFERIKTGIKDSLAPSRNHISVLSETVKTRRDAYKSDRSAEAQCAVENDFDALLQAWGIGDAAQLSSAINDLRLRCVLLALPCLMSIGLVLFVGGVSVWMAGLCIALPCVMGIVIATWRISVLRQHRYTPVVKWLLGLLGFLPKKSA